MLAQKKTCIPVLLLMAFCMMLSVVLAEGGLTVEAVDATTLAVRWEGAASDRYSVSYAVEGTDRLITRTVVGTEVLLFDLAPATSYEIEVRKAGGGATSMVIAAATPTATNFRTHNFKRENFKVYLVENYYSDFWDNERIALDTVDRAEFEASLPDYFFVALIDKTWDTTPGEKTWEALIVLRTPDGGVYTEVSPQSCDGSWDSLSTFYDLSGIVGQYTDDTGEWLLGDYTVELYMNGQFAGRAYFTLKDGAPSILQAPTAQPAPQITEAPTAQPAPQVTEAPTETSRLFAPPLLVTAAPVQEPTQAPAPVLPTAPPQAPPTAPPQAPPTAPPQAPPTAPPQAPPTAPPQAPPTAPPQVPPKEPPMHEPVVGPTQVAPAFGNLKVRVDSPVSASVTWEGPVDETYVLILGVGGLYEAFSLDEGDLWANIYILIPGTDYEVSIFRVATGEMLDAYITTPEANAYRAYSYRWNVCRVYAVNEANAGFWENGRKRVENETVAGIKELRRQGRLSVIIDFWWEKSNADKTVDVTLAMRTPEGYLFYQFSQDTFDKNWEGAYLGVSFEDLVDEYLEYAGEWATGTYRFELYFDDQFAGRTSFTLN